ncbi:MAG: hypothetical protein ACMXYC_01615 [Candidatus Woesearchaeota archaeon]
MSQLSLEDTVEQANVGDDNPFVTSSRLIQRRIVDAQRRSEVDNSELDIGFGAHVLQKLYKHGGSWQQKLDTIDTYISDMPLDEISVRYLQELQADLEQKLHDTSSHLNKLTRGLRCVYRNKDNTQILEKSKALTDTLSRVQTQIQEKIETYQLTKQIQYLEQLTKNPVTPESIDEFYPILYRLEKNILNVDDSLKSRLREIERIFESNVDNISNEQQCKRPTSSLLDCSTVHEDALPLTFADLQNHINSTFCTRKPDFFYNGQQFNSVDDIITYRKKCKLERKTGVILKEVHQVGLQKKSERDTLVSIQENQQPVFIYKGNQYNSLEEVCGQAKSQSWWNNIFSTFPKSLEAYTFSGDLKSVHEHFMKFVPHESNVYVIDSITKRGDIYTVVSSSPKKAKTALLHQAQRKRVLSNRYSTLQPALS